MPFPLPLPFPGPGAGGSPGVVVVAIPELPELPEFVAVVVVSPEFVAVVVVSPEFVAVVVVVLFSGIPITTMICDPGGTTFPDAGEVYKTFPIAPAMAVGLYLSTILVIPRDCRD